ncbi:unnamed protein product, partial [Laminaria digitata]
VFVSRPVFPFAPRALLAASFLALAACAQSNLAAPPADPQPAPVVQAAPTPDPAPVAAQAVASDIVRVGIMVPLSGSAAGVGRDLLDAAQLALFDFTPPLFELRVYDSGSSPVIAASAAARARADGVRILLGPLFSEAVTAAADVLRPHGIPVYAFSSDRLVSGNGVYVAGFFPEAQIARTVEFAVQRGMFRFASLVPDDSYGGRMSAVYSGVVQTAGGEVVASRFYPFDTEGRTATV